MGLSSGDEKRLLSLVWGRLLSLQAHGRYLMSPNLHAALTQKSTSYAIQSAELIQPTEGSVPPQLKWKDVSLNVRQRSGSGLSNC